MRVLFYKDNIVTEVVSVRSLNDLTEEDRKHDFLSFTSSMAIQGTHIEAINIDGTVKPISEQVDIGLIVLKDNEILEGEIIKNLTEDELKEKFPERYPNEDFQVENQEKTIIQAIQDKHSDINVLKGKYVDADIDDDELLKSELKIQIQEARQELNILESELNEHGK